LPTLVDTVEPQNQCGGFFNAVDKQHGGWGFGRGGVVLQAPPPHGGFSTFSHLTPGEAGVEAEAPQPPGEGEVELRLDVVPEGPHDGPDLERGGGIRRLAGCPPDLTMPCAHGHCQRKHWFV